MESRGVGYVNREGDVRSLENIQLFRMDRKEIGQHVKFVRFSYENIELGEHSEEEVLVNLKGLKVVETSKHHYGPVDSLSKLFHKAAMKYGSLRFHQILATL